MSGQRCPGSPLLLIAFPPLSLLSSGSRAQCLLRNYWLTAPPAVSVPLGLCVIIPCNFTYEQRHADRDAPLYGYWFEAESVYTGAPVATNNPRKTVQSYTRNRFTLSEHLDQGDCSLTIKNARKTDRKQYIFRVEREPRAKFTYSFYAVPYVNVTGERLWGCLLSAQAPDFGRDTPRTVNRGMGSPQTGACELLVSIPCPRADLSSADAFSICPKRTPPPQVKSWCLYIDSLALFLELGKPEIRIPRELRAGQPVNITCTAPASCPPMSPNMTWEGISEASTSGISAMLPSPSGSDVYRTVFNFRPSVADHGKLLTCSVSYGKGPRAVQTAHTFMLDVHCDPRHGGLSPSAPAQQGSCRGEHRKWQPSSSGGSKGGGGGRRESGGTGEECRGWPCAGKKGRERCRDEAPHHHPAAESDRRGLLTHRACSCLADPPQTPQFSGELIRANRSKFPLHLHSRGIAPSCPTASGSRGRETPGKPAGSSRRRWPGKTTRPGRAASPGGGGESNLPCWARKRSPGGSAAASLRTFPHKALSVRPRLLARLDPGLAGQRQRAAPAHA
uniref:Ig-like domain-containing protein n=1 Tax=Varanus komodoensis TaxID=61221 RepID=A0A8D2JCD3_VARKO